MRTDLFMLMILFLVVGGCFLTEYIISTREDWLPHITKFFRSQPEDHQQKSHHKPTDTKRAKTKHHLEYLKRQLNLDLALLKAIKRLYETRDKKHQ